MSQFTEFEQVEMKVKAAQKLVGYATMSMDQQQLNDASTAIEQARTQLEKMKAVATDLDEEFLGNQETELQQVEQQLLEARQ
jgi:predicted secreted acid phosphatase